MGRLLWPLKYRVGLQSILTTALGQGPPYRGSLKCSFAPLCLVKCLTLCQKWESGDRIPLSEPHTAAVSGGGHLQSVSLAAEGVSQPWEFLAYLSLQPQNRGLALAGWLS